MASRNEHPMQMEYRVQGAAGEVTLELLLNENSACGWYLRDIYRHESGFTAVFHRPLNPDDSDHFVWNSIRTF